MGNHRRQRGQALIMVTFGLIAMFGVMGLAMDLGWAYYQQKTAQAAVDAAAMSAAGVALTALNNGATLACGNVIQCTTSPAPSGPPGANVQACPGSFGAGGSLKRACDIASANGFSNSGLQTVNVDATVILTSNTCGSPPPANCIPTVKGVVPLYWVTVRVSQQRHQLFSAILGNTMGVSSARATAAVLGVGQDASIILTNQAADPVPSPLNGTNLYLGSGNGLMLTVPGGIRMASSNGSGATNACALSRCAGQTANNAQVQSKYTQIYSTGGVNIPGNWLDLNGNQQSTNGEMVNMGRNSLFDDPFAGRGQPPINGASSLPNCPVLATNGNNAVVSNVTLGPGNYYVVRNTGNQRSPTWVATGGTLKFGAGVTFAATSNGTSGSQQLGGGAPNDTCQAGVSSPNSFGTYILWGGLADSGANSVATVESGTYVLAGGGLNVSSNAILTDNQTGGQNTSYPGELFILTNDSYNPGGTSSSLATIKSGNSLLAAQNFSYSSSSVQAGNCTGCGIALDLHGLSSSALTSVATNTNVQGKQLSDFGSVAIWQDQGNSYINYDPSQSGVPLGTTNTSASGNTPQLQYTGGAHTKFYGIMYQPRGAWTVLQGNGNSSGANYTQLVTGGIQLQGAATINFDMISTPVVLRVLALVE